MARQLVEETYEYDGLVYLLQAWPEPGLDHWSLEAYPSLPDGSFSDACDYDIAYDIADTAPEGLELMKAVIRERADLAASRMTEAQGRALAVRELVESLDGRVTGPWRPIDPGDLPPFESNLANRLAWPEPYVGLASVIAAADLPPCPLLPHADASDRIDQARAILIDAGAWPFPG